MKSDPILSLLVFDVNWGECRFHNVWVVQDTLDVSKTSSSGHLLCSRWLWLWNLFHLENGFHFMSINKMRRYKVHVNVPTCSWCYFSLRRWNSSVFDINTDLTSALNVGETCLLIFLSLPCNLNIWFDADRGTWHVVTRKSLKTDSEQTVNCSLNFD